MRGDIVFRVFGVHRGRAEDVCFGTFATRARADAEIAKLAGRGADESWARTYHDQGFVIREVVVDIDFEIPSLPKPRDAWALRTVPVSN